MQVVCVSNVRVSLRLMGYLARRFKPAYIDPQAGVYSRVIESPAEVLKIKLQQMI